MMLQPYSITTKYPIKVTWTFKPDMAGLACITAFNNCKQAICCIEPKTRHRRTCSSFTVIVPDPSASMVLNRRFMPAISSADRHAPTTISAVFFNLCMAAKFFIRERTTLSSGLSEPWPSCFSHGCWRISEHVGLHMVDRGDEALFDHHDQHSWVYTNAVTGKRSE